MLPLHLTLKNFMSYGDEPTSIDFRGLGVVCLSGENGHGKSAILDAITWALWGETRLGKQNHDQLVRLGADEMSVLFEFQEGEAVYRVRRQRSRRAGSQLWEIQILEDGGSWRPISGQTSGDTGRAIVQLLRMNYETFLNSAYLRQGRADEFVRQTANKRKEILAEILDLSRFDDLEVRARLHMREASDRALDAGRFIQQIESEVAEEQTIAASLAQVEARIAEIDAKIALLQARNQQLTETGATLASQRKQLDDAKAGLLSVNNQIERHRTAIEAERAGAENAKKLLADRSKIEAEYARYESTRVDFDRLQAQSHRFHELDRRRVEIDHGIESEKREIEHAVAVLDRQLTEVRQALAELPAVQKSLDTLKSNAQELTVLKARRQQTWDEQTALANTLADLRADYDRCAIDVKTQKERLEAIAVQGESCSICGSPLPPDKLNALIDDCANVIETLEARLAELKRDGSAKQAEKRRLTDTMASSEKDIARLETACLDLGTVQAKLTIIEQLRDEKLPSLESEIAIKKRILDSAGYAEKLRGELAAILPELDRLGDADQKLSIAHALISELTWCVEAHTRLQSAQHELASANTRIGAAEAAITNLEIQRETVSKALEGAGALDAKIAETTRDVQNIRRDLSDASEELQSSRREQGKLQNQIDRIAKMRAELIQRRAQLQEARSEEELFTLLAGSFGKRGVQALIIENALPELENDANDLLHRLTDDQMSIAIQTTRIAKSKTAADAPIETLDIAISDYLGTRQLEMYSGGESFRVAFALRIALSKLLTRRAGAQLQTLIIDEGFGTQDAKGREKLVDAILAIQGEFAQIIVITHVEELKDAFPNRIEVVKTTSGTEVMTISGASLG